MMHQYVVFKRGDLIKEKMREDGYYIRMTHAYGCVRERKKYLVRVVKEGSICKVQEKRKRERCWFFCVSSYKN